MVKGMPKVLYGTIAVVSADNLGSLALGGFKESCTATKMCRHCMTTRDESREKVIICCNNCELLSYVVFLKFAEQHFQLRNKTDHITQCEEIKTDPTHEKSKEYGINRDSILNELKYFHVCDGSLIPDIMHDVLEGVLQYEVKLMLRQMINVNHYFTLEVLNSRLENMELSSTESKKRPTSLEQNNLNSDGSSLKQNG